MDFDPKVIGYQQLLDVFWREHDPCGTSWSVQYKAILFHQGDAQRQVAEASAKQVHVLRGRPVTTEVRPAGRFWLAEDYHQKYALKRERALLASLQAIHPTEAELRESTAAARLNAHVYGDLDLATLRTELAALGLETIGVDRVTGVRRRS